MIDPWKLIASAPTDGRLILVAVKGQFCWSRYLAQAAGPATQRPGYAKPSIWTDIEDAPAFDRG